MNSGRVLVIEDDRYSREMTCHMFTFHQWPADVAATAEDALEFLASNQYALVVIDLALPGMDGWALLRILKSLPHLAVIPCVAITAYHDTSLARQALQAGFSAYYPKPLQTSFVPQLRSTFLK